MNEDKVFEALSGTVKAVGELWQWTIVAGGDASDTYNLQNYRIDNEERAIGAAVRLAHEAINLAVQIAHRSGKAVPPSPSPLTQ
ncbi:MAG: hypothetical protein WA628_25805 [Terriglobales bacterium]